MTPFVNLLFSSYTSYRSYDCDVFFMIPCKNLRWPPLPPCLFLTNRKRLPFYIHFFPRSAYLTDILHNNLHISRHRYNYSAGALLMHLDISNKYLLVNITQAFRFFPKILFSSYVIDMSGILAAFLHTSIL